ncbi:hypothetical protein EDD61_13113 [Longicatena caecimuris]|uniref:Uncharacterized protein n=2 Tax=Longicatena caecimuris TaxID=1796635 RepID=A0A4R3SX58_9FIRM|nr:hypothetical protein EDD61_13113 [Longicatena caecimuris]
MRSRNSSMREAYEKENDAVHAMFRTGLNECVQLERKGIYIWYVANDEVWIPHEQEPYTSIKDARIDAVNAYLKELKKPY